MHMVVQKLLLFNIGTASTAQHTMMSTVFYVHFRTVAIALVLLFGLGKSSFDLLK